MCLAVPAKIVEKQEMMATVDISGVTPLPADAIEKMAAGDFAAVKRRILTAMGEDGRSVHAA